MQVLTGARRASGLIAALVMLAGLTAWASPAAASQPATSGKQAGTTTRPLAHIAGWSAGPVRLGTGYHRHDGSRRVREAQRRLNRLGYEPGPADGRFGAQTDQATRRFQLRHGLSVDGVVGAKTLSALRAESAPRRATADWSAGPVGPGTGYARPTGSVRVREVQWDLRRLTYATGPVDGLFGPLTEAATRSFQAHRGLVADGVVGRRMLLALRSRVPHASAPRPATRPPSFPASRHATPPPRPDAARVLDTPPPLPITLVIVALVMLGVLTVAVNYVRTQGRVRSAQRAAAQQAAAEREGPRVARRNGVATRSVPTNGQRSVDRRAALAMRREEEQ